jgi:predicted MPP superfamily phosphohydrolase
MRPLGSFFIFLAVVLGVLGGLHRWIYVNLASAGLPTLPTTLALWALALAFPASRIGALRFHGRLMRFLYWSGSLWMGLGFMLAFWLLVAWIARQALSLAGFDAWTDPRWWVLGTTFLTLAFGARGVARALGPPVTVRYAVDRSARFGGGRKARLVQISDVHLGLILGTDWFHDLVDRINALEPDAVLITGDFIDGEYPDDEGAVRELRRLKAPHGVFAVSGNHEFYAGIDRFLALMGKAGAIVLDNEVRVLPSGLQVAGIHDLTAGRKPGRRIRSDLPRAVEGIDPSIPSILLAHQPKLLEGAAEKRVDLVLSGHTHEGQIFPFRFLVRLAFRHLAGRHRIGPETELIVCTGTGFWGPPLRVGTDSQLVVIDFAW